GGSADGEDLGMSGGIHRADGPVAALADHHPVPDQHRAHRHLAGGRSLPCQRQRPAHPGCVSAGAGSGLLSGHSHSMVAGGLLDTSYTTRETPSISLMMRFDTCPMSSYGRCAQRAVMKSTVSTARRAMTSA